MKILLILPNWLGDGVMASAAIESLCESYPQARLTLVGSAVSIEALKHHPLCVASYIDHTKKSLLRVASTYSLAKKIGPHDIAISFRDNIYANLLLKLTDTPITISKKSISADILLLKSVAVSKGIHLVEQYQKLIDVATSKAVEPGRLRLFVEPHSSPRALLGINAGSTYGSAKRWEPKRFAEVAAHFCDRYDILIFGSSNERVVADEIEKHLVDLGVSNYLNLAGETTVEELIASIASLDLLITNDSGPMHVAAAYGVTTVAIFGSTKSDETSQWRNPKSSIVRVDIECAPCMKRTCPLGHHDCMKRVTSDMVIDSVGKLIRE